MPAYPKNDPFYNWVPKPIGIIILFMFFLPILTVGGTYSASGTEMMSGLDIISEHIQFANFATSIGMAAFCPFLYRLVCSATSAPRQTAYSCWRYAVCLWDSCVWY